MLHGCLDTSLCFWNINGAKNKFEVADVVELFDTFDIVIIGETHFNIRIKCPEKFYLVGKSKPLFSKKPRGGIAVYKKYNSRIKLRLLSDDFPDAVILEIEGSNIVIMAIYITPSNSVYFNDQYFQNLKIFLDLYVNCKTIIIIGDLNARISNEFPSKGFMYQSNPDKTKNFSGKILNDILMEYNDILLINGLRTQNKYFDSKFTFYRSNRKSQIDVCLSNNANIINEFLILDKLYLSDHCPISLKFNVKISYPFQLLAGCTRGFLNYDHYDRSKDIKTRISLKDCDVRRVIQNLNELGNNINISYKNPPTCERDINKLCTEVTDGIYEACRRNKRKRTKKVKLLINDNCNSENYKAIANINLMQYERLKEIEPNRAEHYRNEWLHFQALTLLKKEEEESTNRNEKWNKWYKHDARRLWKQIEWKPKTYIENESVADNVMHKFFSDIFQSPTIRDQPTLQHNAVDLNSYHVFSNVTDANITIDEVDKALKKIGKGTSFDGLSPDILHILPTSLTKGIWILFRSIFGNYYPEIWRNQLLMGIPKKEHTLQEPKLRGIAIGPLLSRVFDILINERFTSWYIPNAQQSGFRKHQGCLIPIFSMFLIIDMSKYLKKKLFIGLFDYEKAFDYLNRSQLLDKMMDNEIGTRFAKNFYNIYEDTSYILQSSKSSLGETITTSHGVTQGKNSSANLFSFYISDMSIKVNENIDINKEFMRGHNVLQLADDSVLLAEDENAFIRKASALELYSKEKHMKINLKKTKYISAHETSPQNSIYVSNELQIEAVKATVGYNWLGFCLTHSNDLSQLIKFNIMKKMFAINKFHEWLSDNEETPFLIKIKVLDSCLFSSIVYSCETWGDLSRVSDDLLKIERKLLKRILGVKEGTGNNIVFHECSRPHVISVIKERQYNFFKKLSTLTEEDTSLKGVMDLYEIYMQQNQNLKMLNYYKNLNGDDKKLDVEERKNVLHASDTTMNCRYVELSNLEKPHILYKSLHNDKDRIVITRWRLSCHKLFVETGRYKRPKITKEERKCKICNVLEDEEHALYLCDAHQFIRIRYRDLLQKYPRVKEILNPQSTKCMELIATYIREIEENMINLDMVH